jgi:hypothetical protein
MQISKLKRSFKQNFFQLIFFRAHGTNIEMYLNHCTCDGMYVQGMCKGTVLFEENGSFYRTGVADSDPPIILYNEQGNQMRELAPDSYRGAPPGEPGNQMHGSETLPVPQAGAPPVIPTRK